MGPRLKWEVVATALAVATIASACGGSPAPTVTSTKPVQVSSCQFNAEPVQAIDRQYVYEEWIGCGGIEFARSANGGRSFGRARRLPSPKLSGHVGEWDPALAIAPDGTVYAAYMVGSFHRHAAGVFVPAVAVSTDHGATFARVSTAATGARLAALGGDFGDRDWIAAGPNGTLYLTWDYGPNGSLVKLICAKGFSCSFKAGDFNAVLQTSSDGGKTWSPSRHVSPGFPFGGVYSAPIVAQPDGTLDVLYVRVPTNRATHAVSPGNEYFTRSTDGGATWSKPVAVDPGTGTISLETWWIDGSLAVDPGGTLYASWDTQTGSSDTAWLAWSSDGGRHWSAPLRVTSSKAENLVEVAAAGKDDVYVGWQSLVAGKGFATYLRRLSVGHGWTSQAVRVSTAYGKPKTWPGDTFGLSVGPSGAAVTSWGSGIGRSRKSEIFSAVTTLP